MLEFKQAIQDRVQEHYDEVVAMGYEVVGVFLQGSQNYGQDVYTENYMSDVDTKCIILPSLDDIVRGGKPYAHTHERANKEHIDIKDIRDMFLMFEKQNVAYVEILFTDYYVINPEYKDLVEELKSHAEEIAHMDKNRALKALGGTIRQKQKDLCHPFPNVTETIQEFGYNPKNLSHILRLWSFLKKYLMGASYKQCLEEDNEFILGVKTGVVRYNQKDAVDLAKTINDKVKALVFQNINEEIDTYNKDTGEFLFNLKTKIIKRFLIKQLKEEIKNE